MVTTGPGTGAGRRAWAQTAAAPSPLRVVASILTLWLVGGVVYPLLTMASDHLAAVQVTAVRTTGAVLMTTPVLLSRMHGRLHALRSFHAIWPNVVAAVAFYPVGNGLLTYASGHLPSSLSALSFSMLPVLAAVVSALRGSALGRWVWLGIGGSIVSLVLVVGAPGSGVPGPALAAALASVVCWFAGTEFWAARSRDLDLIASVWIQLTVGSIACWVSVALSGSGMPSAASVLQPAVVLLAFSQFIQHVAYLGVAGRVSPLVLTSFAFVNPVVAGLAGYLLLQQRLSVLQAAGSATLLLSVLLVVRGAQRSSARIPGD